MSKKIFGWIAVAGAAFVAVTIGMSGCDGKHTSHSSYTPSFTPSVLPPERVVADAIDDLREAIEADTRARIIWGH